ncbi:Fc.00g108420.m01.CDS01 [Cosmosporella sp. VM-42]
MPEVKPGEFKHRIPVELVPDDKAFIEACNKIFGDYHIPGNYDFTLGISGHHEVTCWTAWPTFLLWQLQDMGVAKEGVCPDSKGFVRTK